MKKIKLNLKKLMNKKLKSNKIISFPVSKPFVSKQDIFAVNKTLKSGWISSDGPEVKNFENKFAKYVDRKFSVAVSSGTAALEIAVKALDIKKNDEVLIPNFTIISNAIAVLKQNAKPVLVGHYKMSGQPKLQSENASSLDYPSTKCVYHWSGEAKLVSQNLTIEKIASIQNS